MDENNKPNWEALVKDYRESGISGKVWCEAHGVKYHTLRYWIKKLETVSGGKNGRAKTKRNPSKKAAAVERTKPDVQEVELNDAAPVKAANEVKREAAPIILRVGALAVEIPPNFDRKTLAELLAIIRETF